MDEHANKLCKSCSGPLSDFDPKDLIHPEFCPYCVNEKGQVKSYKDVLDQMIEYIESDHPEIHNKEEKAHEWLHEGPVWSQKFRAIIIEESLENTDLLKLGTILKTETVDEEDNHGFPVWHIHTL